MKKLIDREPTEPTAIEIEQFRINTTAGIVAQKWSLEATKYNIQLLNFICDKAIFDAAPDAAPDAETFG